jgi:hypothetical protein
MPTEELASWAEWALALAARIYPIVSGSYRARRTKLEEYKRSLTNLTLFPTTPHEPIWAVHDLGGHRPPLGDWS